MFAVDDLDDTLARLGKLGAKVVDEVVDYEGIYRLCYIRGVEGLLIGLRMIPPSSEMVDELRAEKMITVAAGDNVVRLLPPLIIGETEIAEAIARIDRACARLAANHARQVKQPDVKKQVAS